MKTLTKINREKLMQMNKGTKLIVSNDFKKLKTFTMLKNPQERQSVVFKANPPTNMSLALLN